MKTKLVIAALPLLVLLACGSDSGQYTLSSGTYGLSNSTVAPPDDCNQTGALRDGDSIQIAVSGSNVTFSFKPPPNASNDPVATLQGNTINPGSKSHFFDNNTWPPPQNFMCVEKITLAVSGNLLANDQVQCTLIYTSEPQSGNQCTAQNLGYRTYPPCNSTLSFIAKKR
jgi:hypothetical protein